MRADNLPAWFYLPQKTRTQYRERESQRRLWLKEQKFQLARKKSQARKDRIAAAAHLTPAQQHYGNRTAYNYYHSYYRYVPRNYYPRISYRH